ncbi:hypothetical protein [Streptomyces sp. WMMB 322]|uniref:hypothetical protein n=1 Tax=Streptomyces sp. WMMB 322 TaxID=1286821 RepID=UPI000823E4F9|nr:hypothetical protein [Streptomyces sp. WMMB 322]SCK36009.1 hypothetical protein H180DRAFT_02998 [Streptomyces sp. WMMB 322]
MALSVETAVVIAVAGGEFGGWGWWAIGGAGVLVLSSIFVTFFEGWKMRKFSYEEQVEIFLKDLHSGAVTVRGHIRLNPVKYTKLTDKDADRIADEAGYYRQTFGTKGNWLFLRSSADPPDSHS